MRRTPLLFAAALAATAASFAGSASAAEPVDASATEAPRFGSRGSAIVSIENVFGYSSQEFHSTSAGGSYSFDHKGFTPGGIVGLGFGIHGVSSHVTYGASVGFWGGHSTNDNGSGNTTKVFHLGPRIGYAGAVDKNVGFWVRGGPTLYYFDKLFGDESITTFDLTLEAFGVYSPTPHLGLMLGPSFDIALAGHVSGASGSGADDLRFKTLSMNIGLLSDF